jgi:tryptophan 2,3-dioxygenase
MLFIVIHQVYELWFKQLLHELRHLQGRLEAGDSSHSLHTLRRVLTILKVAVAQVDVLETMTPRQFTSFRSRLAAASGFQSVQFRVLEAVMGRRDINPLDQFPEDSQGRVAVADAMGRPGLFDSFLRYLVHNKYAIPARLLRRDVTQPAEPSSEVQAALLAAYRDDGAPAQVAERLVDLDEGFQEWRYRHLKMVERTIGDKAGTGGSSGVGYLQTTLFAPAFPDLWAVRRAL